jgi:hypothetical protein
MIGEYSFNKKIKKRPGSASWVRYEAYKSCTTTTAALANGCTMADLTWDWEITLLKYFDPSLILSRAEVEE